MQIAVGDKIPDLTLKHMTPEGPANVTTADLFGGKKVVLFAVPGAFTPTCSARHLPGFVERAADIRAKGVDDVVCVAVNDVFVMDAWGKAGSAADKVHMVADGNGDFAKAIGLTMDGSGFGLGTRSQRYSMVVEDGEVKAIHVEQPGAFEVSSADHVLGVL